MYTKYTAKSFTGRKVFPAEVAHTVYSSSTNYHLTFSLPHGQEASTLLPKVFQPYASLLNDILGKAFPLVSLSFPSLIGVFVHIL